MMLLWSAIGGAGIVGGICMMMIQRLFTEKDKRDETRADAAREESVMIIKSIEAVGHLSEATAKAHQKGVFNGNIDTALAYYDRVRDEMNDFLIRQNAAANH